MAIHRDDTELLSDKVNNFLSNNRKVILSVIAVLVAVIIGLTVYFSFVAKKKADDIASIEKIIFDLNKEKEDIEKKKEEDKKKLENESKKDDKVLENSSSDNIETVATEDEKKDDEKNEDKDEEENKTDPQILEKEDMAIPKLEELAKNASGYASYLAFYNIADMYFARKDYAKAKDYYSKAMQTIPNSYVLGVLFFNIAVCMEELSENDGDVLAYYKKASEVEDFPLKPRAMFNVARIQEKMGKNEDAVATYKDILEKYPDNDFALIGKTRIIKLEIQK